MESVFDNSGCTANRRVWYAARCFVNKALTWWNTQVQAIGREATIGMSWNDFRALLAEELCPSNKMEKLENDFWNHTMVGANYVAHTDRFHELAKLLLLFDAQEIPDEFYGGTYFFLRLVVKTACTTLETNKSLIKDEEVEDVDVHLYRSMIGSLMYLTASRPDIMFAVCACARIPSIFDLEAFSDSDYAGASLDRKSTIGCCQFLGKRLISWQCKKQTIVANSVTPPKWIAAEYVSRSVTS
ncbi:hypothetical protein Tco_0560744 [Tanacetum coccineum]